MLLTYNDGRPMRPMRFSPKQRAGFTLVELLVVIVIMLLLAAMTAAAVNLSINNDKCRAGARQVQSYLAGARDRAIYAQAPRGVRFLLDPTNNRTVSSMIFIQQTAPWTQGTVQLERLDQNNDGVADLYNATTNPNPSAMILRGFDYDQTNPNATPTGWLDLVNEGLLYNGASILIPNDSTGTWYTVTTELLASASTTSTPPPAYYPPRLHLTVQYANGSNNPNGAAAQAFLNGGPQTYMLQLPNSVLPNSEPVLMPKGCVVHLDRCTSASNLEQITAGVEPNRGDKLPSSWKNYSSTSVDPTGFDYTPQMDILFSPRGVVIGPACQRGIIHLYIADQKDADRDRLVYWSSTSYPTASAPEYGVASDGYERGDKAVLSLFTRTGAVLTSSIYSNADPFKFAETGEVAGK